LCDFIHWELVVEGEHNLGMLSEVRKVVIIHTEQDVTLQTILVTWTNRTSHDPKDLGDVLLFRGHGGILGYPDGKGHPQIE